VSDLRVHGMGRDLVAPDWPPLTLPEVRRLLHRYGLTARRIRWPSPRPLSAAALVETDERVVFVKRHAEVVRTAEGLHEEHAFAAHLRAAGVPVPDVLVDRTGSSTVTGGGWTWEVHAQGEGDDTYRDTLSWEPVARVQHAFAVGSTLARIALAAKDFPAPARRPQLLVTSWQVASSPDLLPALERFVAARPLLAQALSDRDVHADVRRVLAPLHAQLVPHLPALPSAWTHGDGHASNFLWQGDRVSAVLDLGLADRTTPLLDLATALERHAVSWLDAEPVVRLELVDANIAGWNAVRPLSPQEVAALPELLPLVHVDFALSETAYFSGVTRSRANVDLAYDGYLLGHAAWFAGPRGEELRAHLAAGPVPFDTGGQDLRPC
jgi:Ser/Thr protein kinase RdoA (MazF antagonist)